MGAAATARWRGVVRGTLGEGPGHWGAVTTKSRDLHRDSAFGEGARGQKVRASSKTVGLRTQNPDRTAARAPPLKTRLEDI